MEFNIQRHGRKWSRSEVEQKYHNLCPEKIELIEGKMFWTDEQRLNMLALLLENVGMDAAVKLGDPTPERDLLYVDDHVDAYLTCFNHPKAIGQIFNFATGEKVTVKALAEKMCELTGFRGQILWETIPRRPLDIQVLYGDASKAKSVLGWQSKVTLEQGLRLSIDFWRKKLSGADAGRVARTATN